MKKSNKSQMETIGITIIVVLVLIGVMFGIQFVLKQAPSEVGTEFRQSQLAANFLNTLAGTTTGYQYNSLTFTQIVQKCAEDSAACENARTVAQSILSSTFEKPSLWQNYYFTIKKGTTDMITPLLPSGQLTNPCSAEKQSKSYPIPTRAGTVTMTLDLC